MANDISRRRFLQYGALMAGGSIGLAGCGSSGSGGSGNTPNSGGNNPGGQPGTSPGNGEKLVLKSQDRALVCVMLGGGNDSFNMLVPTSDKHYSEYAKSRSNLALNRSDLLALNGFSDSAGRRFGVHPAMPEMQRLFNQGMLAYVANTAPIIQPTTKAQFKDNSVPLPVGLMSHSDQFSHWQTVAPGIRSNRGWFGKLADVAQANLGADQVPMNISLAGSNVQQLGVNAREYAITKEGSVGLRIQDRSSALDRAIFDGFNAILKSQTNGAFRSTYLDILNQAQRHHEKFRGATEKIQVRTQFSDTPLSQELKMVAKSIAASAELGLPQRTFFLHYYGWDHHDELLQNHHRMLRLLSRALSEFQEALNELNVADNTVTYTGSDFGRTLTSNGNGTDHAWGGNMMVLGKAVKGGVVYGQYPSLALNNDLDVGSGIMIPTTSIDEVFAELALWFGAEKPGLGQLFPNLSNFYALNSKENPLGFLA